MSQTAITYEQLKTHVTKNDLYLLINGKVYNVSKFVDEHPGGDEVLLAEAGKDATEAFEDVGHSDEARALLTNMLVGEFEKNSALKFKTTNKSAGSPAGVNNAVEQGSNLMYFIPIAFLGAYFAWRYYSA